MERTVNILKQTVVKSNIPALLVINYTLTLIHWRIYNLSTWLCNTSSHTVYCHSRVGYFAITLLEPQIQKSFIVTSI